MSETLTLPETLSATHELASSLLSGAANHEIRALSLIAMQPGQSYGLTAIRNAVLDASGSRNGQMTGHTSIRSYLQDSLQPEGLVELTDAGAAITPLGETFGKAMAGHMLWVSLHGPDEVSLRRLWGMRHSRIKEERPQYPRYEIYKYLLTHPRASVSELHTAVGGEADYSTTNHRSRILEEDGMVEAVLLQPRGVEYGLLSIDALKRMHSRNRTGISKDVNTAVSDVADISPTTRFWTIEVFDHAVDRLGYPDTPQTYANIKARLQRLSKGGVLKDTGRDEQSDRIIWLEPGKISVVESAVKVVDSLLQNPEHFLQEGLDKADLILEDPEAVRVLIRKCLDNSPQASSEYAQRGS